MASHTAEQVPLEDGQKTPHVTESSQPLTCPVSGQAELNGLCPASAPSIGCQEVDPELLRMSIEDRMVYVKDFIGFGRPQADILKKVAPLVHESIPQIVDDLYAKLFEFDITKQVFMERNQGFDGDLPEKLDDLTLDSPQIVYRKVFMKAWARRVLTSDYTNNKIWAYMDKVGIMHTGVKSFKHRNMSSPLHVPYRDCALTLGWVSNVLQTAILQLPESTLTMSDKIDAVSAVTKVIWIQNDLFARHYINE